MVDLQNNTVLFISGIGTNVGRSYATGWLAKNLMAEGINVMTQKMIQTGNKNFSEDIDIHRKIMQIQQKNSQQNLKKWLGKKYKVLIENISFDGKFLIGRTMQDVPDMDGLVFIQNEKENAQELINQFAEAQIIDTKEYDLIAKLVD